MNKNIYTHIYIYVDGYIYMLSGPKAEAGSLKEPRLEMAGPLLRLEGQEALKVSSLIAHILMRPL